MKRSLLLLTAFTLAILPTAANAHFLWAALDPSTHSVRIGLHEHPSEEPLALGERASQVKAWSKSAKTLNLKVDSNWLTAPVSDETVAVTLDYGVIDRKAEGRGVLWLTYHAKAAASYKASQTKLGLPLELIASEVGGKPVVTVLQDGKPFTGADIVVTATDGSTAFEGKSGAKGIVELPASAGPLAVRALIIKPGKGTHTGKEYEQARSYCSLTIGSFQKAGRPLTSLISESFGDNHDVVGNTGFIRTLMAGKVTKAQVEAHFQQRAFVHEEIHRVLLDAKKPPLAYGKDQKDVLVLLFADLVHMGSRWPAASEAWPLTRSFVNDIRSSAKEGPYYALGVMHVYFGGITHGGRDIGQKIADTIGFSPTYYLKSDGYRAYADLVNKITDPKDQAAMIRGGQAAYRYIIASNDDVFFASK